MIKRELSKHSILLKNVAALVILSFFMILTYIQIIKQRGWFWLKGRFTKMVSLHDALQHFKHQGNVLNVFSVESELRRPVVYYNQPIEFKFDQPIINNFNVPASNVSTDKKAVKMRRLKSESKPASSSKPFASSRSAATNATKVLLLASHRSGSTFLGEIFNQNSEAFYLFEPLGAVQGMRLLPVAWVSLVVVSLLVVQ